MRLDPDDPALQAAAVRVGEVIGVRIRQDDPLLAALLTAVLEADPTAVEVRYITGPDTVVAVARIDLSPLDIDGHADVRSPWEAWRHVLPPRVRRAWQREIDAAARAAAAIPIPDDLSALESP